ncbi:PREDICTED: uncharacterized threonine-rich GPI-anchored glycoprotein PJ4664.02-like isoform X1 [Amphimedon queenslandica]|uniref:Uncharacterized protein n=1 Tax=Amphimedon queenslandica TaxID=400682 RepID=A0AAN0JFR0_AMPQE|nr:PREDICTED: uncharacterized threonine-rich GPI-anchored glycoprotein PJ4664.02-like isoform X1 [Amphimedon queenslandica]|eukprot:XP_019855627.1 PREDICTED: uncharacterized threonine-rich GPI-anchored glycoprotein PJ4664.02-like isoform X1 [Amphimedon queenslandica]
MKLLAVENLFYLILLVLSKGFVYGDQGCTEKFMELSQVTYRAQYTSASAPGRTWDDKLRALQEYQFNCSSTNVTSLILGIDVRRATGSINLFPSVRVYRPNSNDPGKYDLVTGSERTIYYSTSNVSTSGVFEYPLNPPIPVMSGEVVAIVQPREEESVVRIYYIEGVSGISFSSSKEISIDSDEIDLGDTPITNELILVYPVTDGHCVNSANSINAMAIRNYFLTVQRSGAINDRRQYLYPEIVFSCNGSLTKWIYGGMNHNNMNNNSPELQIWRQLGPNNYNKIGSSLVNANTMIGTNLYEFIPQTPLQFQEGDIFGVHIPQTGQSVFSLYEQRGNGPLNERVNGDADNPYSTITQALVTDSNNDFPLVTVEVSISLASTSVVSSSSTSPVISTTSVITTSTMISSTVVSITLSNALSILVTAIPSLLSSTYSSSSFYTTPVSSTVIITTAPSDSSVIATTVNRSSSTAISGMTSPGSSSSIATSTKSTTSSSASVVSTVNSAVSIVISVSSHSMLSTAILSIMEPSSLSSSVVSTSTSSTTANTTPVAVYIIVGIVVCIILASLVIIVLSVAVCIKKKGHIIIDSSDMEDNPAYIATNPIAVTIQDNPAYATNVGNECNAVDYEELNQVIAQDYDEIDDCV